MHGLLAVSHQLHLEQTPQAEQEFKTLKYLLQGILTISTKYL